MATSTSSSATCSLCSELYVDPRMLQCLHTFCGKCLKTVLKKQRSKATLKCPTCKASEKLPKGGVDALPKDLRKSHEAEVAELARKIQSEEAISCDVCVKATNGPAVSFCNDCREFLCKTCLDHHQISRRTLDHALQPVGSEIAKCSKDGQPLPKIPRKSMTCPLHEDETLKFYCNTCGTLICRDCMAIEHSGHAYDRMEKVAEKEKVNLLSNLEAAEGAKAKLEEATTKGGKVIQQVRNRQKEVEKSIRSTFKTLAGALSKREKVLLTKTAEISLGKQTALTMQEEEFQKLHKEITETCELIKVATQDYDPAEMLSAKGLMTSKLDSLLKCYKKTDLDPCRSDMITSMLDTAEVVEEINSFGEVLGGSCPGKADTDLFISRAVVRQEKEITITTNDANGGQFPHGGESVKASLSLMGSNDPVLEAKVTDNNDGTYIASFIPQTVGEHQLSITIDNVHIESSPMSVYVRQQRDYMRISSSQNTFPLSYNPFDVAVDDNGDVYVALVNYGIEVYNQHGRLIRIIGAPSQSPQPFYLPSPFPAIAGASNSVPCSVNVSLKSPTAVDIHDGMLYVADNGQNCVQKITTSGEFVLKFGSDHLKNPRGICIDHSSGRVFVSSEGNSRVSIFEADGTFVSQFGEGYLNQPWGLAFDNSGNLHVASTNTSMVLVFTFDGDYMESYDSGVNSPAGIAIDDEGYTFIAEYGSSERFDRPFKKRVKYARAAIINVGEVKVLNPLHKVIHTFLNVKNAMGITVDKEGFVYVCDYGGRQVHKC